MVMSRKTFSPTSASSSRLALAVVRTKIPTAHIDGGHGNNHQRDQIPGALQRPEVPQQHGDADDEGQARAVPRQDRAFPGKTAPPGPAGSPCPAGSAIEPQSFPKAATTTASTPTTTMPRVRTSGMVEVGSGSPRRMARWLARQCWKLSAATTAPRAMSGRPSRRRPPLPTASAIVDSQPHQWR